MRSPTAGVRCPLRHPGHHSELDDARIVVRRPGIHNLKALAVYPLRPCAAEGSDAMAALRSAGAALVWHRSEARSRGPHSIRRACRADPRSVAGPSPPVIYLSPCPFEVATVAKQHLCPQSVSCHARDHKSSIGPPGNALLYRFSTTWQMAARAVESEAAPSARGAMGTPSCSRPRSLDRART